MSTTALGATPSKDDCADLKKACNALIEQADKAIEAAQKALDGLDKTNKELRGRVEDLEKQVVDAKDDSKRWYHNPAVDVPIGAAIAVSITTTPFALIAIPAIIIIGILN